MPDTELGACMWPEQDGLGPCLMELSDNTKRSCEKVTTDVMITSTKALLVPDTVPSALYELSL